MKISYFLLLFNLLFCIFSLAQTKTKSFWRNSPSFIDVGEDSLNYGAVILEDNRHILYTKDLRKTTRHKIVHIYSAEGLDDHNKVYVSVPKAGGIVELKARSISKDGKIVELDESKMEKMDNYSDNSNLQLFAIEGAQVGGQIEYTYTFNTPRYDSGKELLSKDYPTENAYVLITAVEGLYVESKAYNGDFEREATNYKQEFWYSRITPLIDEKYATPDANRAFVEYKIVGFGASASTISSYSTFSRSQVSRFYNFNATEERKASSILKRCKKSKFSGLNLVKFAFNIFRTEFDLKWDYSDDYSTVTKVFANKSGNDIGLTKAFCLILEELDIEYEVHISCNKYDNWLDPEFCSRYTHDDFLIYLTDFNKYISFGSQVLQFNLVPSWVVGNKAAVVARLPPGKNIVEIPSKSPEANMTALDIDISLNLDENSTILNISGFGTGQVSFDYNEQIYYAETVEELQEEKESIVGWRYPNAEVTEIELVNEEDWGQVVRCKDEDCKREYKAKVKSPTFFEQVGDNLILNVGNVLGPQTEMYSERERVQKITCEYNKSYHFTIDIEIPEGYVYVENQGCKINNLFTNDKGVKVAGFTSTLIVKEGIISIDVYEFYNQLNIDKEFYEEYRKIVNSAADFNKATILLKKK